MKNWHISERKGKKAEKTVIKHGRTCWGFHIVMLQTYLIFNRSVARIEQWHLYRKKLCSCYNPRCSPQVHTLILLPKLVVSAGEACVRCKFCGSGAVSLHEPQSHQQKHAGEKPYQCQRCPKKFSLKHQLDTHHRVHTGKHTFFNRQCKTQPLCGSVCSA